MLIYAYNFVFFLSIQLISVSDYVRDTVTFPSDRRLSQQARSKLVFYGRTTYLPCKFGAKASQLFYPIYIFCHTFTLPLWLTLDLKSTVCFFALASQICLSFVTAELLHFVRLSSAIVHGMVNYVWKHLNYF